ncbi:hypothetical protein [Flammeovirga aprica]|uniref:Uncharacterized protein n=1 Tax=Flammeovirga aprica JL-4 TaxID=694437 RepID=A0A7X9RTR2_9BACT|nr:hypothetical protein [Flammeovirga aprica]NME67714.1 hypothetical protein [Flammeovirga aprica JL-4]
MNTKLRLLFILSCVILSTFGVSYGQISTSSLYIKGSALPSGLEKVKLIAADNSNFETILYATQSGEISFETMEGGQVGKSAENQLSVGGTSIALEVEGDHSLFHIHANLEEMSYEITEIKGLSVVTKFDKEGSDWGNTLPLAYSYENTVLSFEMPYSFLFQERYKILYPMIIG